MSVFLVLTKTTDSCVVCFSNLKSAETYIDYVHSITGNDYYYIKEVKIYDFAADALKEPEQ
jgi:hypothetical protein